MTEVNVPLLRKAVEWAEAEEARPEFECRWYQGAWVTPAKDIVRARLIRHWYDENPFEVLPHHPEVLRDIEHKVEQTMATTDCGTCYCIAGYVGQLLEPRYAATASVDGVFVSEFAQKALGLTYSQAEWLFSGDNSITAVRRIAEQIAGEPL